MNKSSRTAAGPSQGRRLSQPTLKGSTFNGPPPLSLDRGRRTSEVVSNPRGNDTVPTSSLSSQYEDKLAGDKVARKTRGIKDTSDGPSFDPDHYNPDGSLRTVHRMPKFNDAYAEASKARYIRHKTLLDREKELSVKQIFEES